MSKPSVILQPMRNHLRMHKQAISRSVAARMIRDNRNRRIIGASGIPWHGCYRQRDAHGRNVYVILADSLAEECILTVSRKSK